MKYKHILLILILGGIFIVNTKLTAKTSYKIPEKKFMEIYDAPVNPYWHFIQFEQIGLEFTYQDKIELIQLADPTVKLAGTEISKRLNGILDKFPIKSLKINFLENNKQVIPELPENTKIRNYKISYDNQKIAVSYETAKGIELLIIELKTGKVRNYNSFLVNDAFGNNGYFWLNDNKTILIYSIPENREQEPNKPLLPVSPIIEETKGKFSQMRTYQNLLTNKYEEELFKYYFTSQPLLLDTETGKTKKLGTPDIISDIDPSPDLKYYLVTRIREPFSYQVPYYYFPKSFEIWNENGEKQQIIHERPLQDQIPIGGTYQGPRYFQWQPLKNAALIWIEALDKGDPKEKVPFRDKIIRSEFPFSLKEEIICLENRYSGIDWSETENEMIIHEYDRDKLWRKIWLYQINTKEKDLLFDLSINDEYNDPGNIMGRKNNRGERIFIKQNNTVFLKNNRGATPDGNFPYLAQYDLKTKKKEILFRSDKNKYERIYNFTSKDLDVIVIISEDIQTPANYFLVDLQTSERKQLTYFQNPYPEITNFQKQLISYERDDGISLSGTLYLPHDYKQGRRLPLVLHAYPEEYADASTAGQINSSPNRFIYFSGSSIKYFVLKGFAVLENASIPIVGNPETVNETFITQTIASAKAAIDYLDKKEIIDPDRVGVIGHSYGAFMVANILAHSDLCTSGIAKSGAYNRTLTPFGFQSERRTLWQARDFYIKVSPFLHAEKINEPLLLIHGENDSNSGTYPLQSKRFYQALKGNGATAKLVILPLEKHGYYARESQLHVISEMIEWFDKYVKNK